MTANAVSDEVLGQIARREHDLFRRVREGTLDSVKVNQSLQAIIEGRFGEGYPNLRFDKRKEGWKLVDHKWRSITQSSILELVRLVPYREPDAGTLFHGVSEPALVGNEIRQRASDLSGDLGQEDAEFLLNHPELIPSFKTWEESFWGPERADSILFPGTVWLSQWHIKDDGSGQGPFFHYHRFFARHLYIPELSLGDGKSKLELRWRSLNDLAMHIDPVLRLRK